MKISSGDLPPASIFPSRYARTARMHPSKQMAKSPKPDTFDINYSTASLSHDLNEDSSCHDFVLDSATKSADHTNSRFIVPNLLGAILATAG